MLAGEEGQRKRMRLFSSELQVVPGASGISLKEQAAPQWVQSFALTDCIQGS